MADVLLVSGGADSIYMLHQHQKNHSRKFFVLYVHHHTRTEEEHSLDIECIKKVMPEYAELVVKHYYHTKGNFEKEASNFRYEAARELALSDKKFPTIYIGHHSEDLTESMMHAIINSGEIPELAKSVYKECMLDIPNSVMTKQEIKDYLVENNIEWHEDSTNTDFTNDRNWIRNFFSKWGSKSRNNLACFVEKYRMYQDYAELQTLPVYEVGYIHIDEYVLLPMAIKYSLIKKVAGTKFKRKYLNEVAKTIHKRTDDNSRKVYLSFGFIVHNGYLIWNEKLYNWTPGRAELTQSVYKGRRSLSTTEIVRLLDGSGKRSA